MDKSQESHPINVKKNPYVIKLFIISGGTLGLLIIVLLAWYIYILVGPRPLADPKGQQPPEPPPIPSLSN